MNPQHFSLRQPSSPTARVVKAAGSRIAGEPSAEAAGVSLPEGTVSGVMNQVLYTYFTLSA